MDYASAAAFVARQARAGDGIIYQGQRDRWLMVGYGLQYYLARDMPNGVPVPHQLFIARTAAEAGTLYPEPCWQPAACLGAEPRIWVIGVGRQKSPYRAVTPAQAAVLRPRYRLSLVKHERGLTTFLLTRAP
jgi:mannosyltransferase